jgi:hypothetical protein
MTLECFSAVTATQMNPGPGQYGVDPYRSLGGPYSLKYKVNSMPRPLARSSVTLTSQIDYPPLNATSTLGRTRRTIAPRYPIISPSTGDVGPSFLPDPCDGFSRYVRIKNRYPTKDVNGTPGPGTYNPKTEWPKTATPPMHSRPAIVLSTPSFTPGPGHYPISRDLSDNSIQFSIRAVSPPAVTGEDNPGYTYNHPYRTGSESRRTSLAMGGIGSGFDRASKEVVPGPGAYNAKDLRGRHRLAPSIHPVLEDPNAARIDVPYENTRRFPDLTQRTIHRVCSAGGYWAYDRSVPGPGWVAPSALDRRPITIRKRIPEKGMGEGNPGPGTYSLPTEAARHPEPRFTFKGPAVRDLGGTRSSLDTPGPGHYNIKVTNNLPRWTVGLRSIRGESVPRVRTSLK